MRKVRLKDSSRRKGKRGGARIVYLHIPEANWIYLIKIYSKEEKDNLTASEKNVLRKLAMEMKREALRTTSRAEQEK